MFSTSQEIVSTIIFGTLFFVFLAIIIIISIVRYQSKQAKYRKEKQLMSERFQKQILKAQLETQEETFDTIGRELHDNIGQLLNSTKLLLGLVQRQTETSDDTLNMAEETLAKAIAELRSLSKSLNRQWLEQFDLIENLKNEINRINIAGGLQIQFTHPSGIPLNHERQLLLFRIIQEAMQNSIKHAAADKMMIDIEEVPDTSTLEIRIHDNGKGFDMNKENQKGIGLTNMQHRSQLLGGTIQWSSAPGGTQVKARIPIQQDKL